MGYEWLAVALKSLRGIDPREVMQVLGAPHRWPRSAKGPDGHVVMTIWARTDLGRPLIIVIRRLSMWEWQILGARELSPNEVNEFEAWETR